MLRHFLGLNMRKIFLLSAFVLLFCVGVLHHDWRFLACLFLLWPYSHPIVLKFVMIGDAYLLYCDQNSYGISHFQIRYSNPYFFCICTPYRSILVFTDELSPKLHHLLHFLASQDA